MNLFFLRVFAPFALGYFLSYCLRTVNAIIAPQLTAEIGLSPASLGFLTAGYFLAFAAMQTPVGGLLDKYRPRRVEAVLLVVAALGSFLFAWATNLELLVFARALIGAGLCCCLMASFRSFGQWLPKERIPIVNGLQLSVGSLGAISATLPAQALLPVMGWRGLFIGLGGLLILTALWLAYATPDPIKSAEMPKTLPAAQNAVTTEKFSPWRHPVFWALMPFAALNVANGMSVQALWVSPWLLDVVGVPKSQLGGILVMVSVGMLLGNLMSGSLATYFAKRNILPHQVGFVLCILALLAQSAFLFNITRAPGLSLFLFGLLNCAGNVIFAGAGHFFAPQVMGRALAAFNLSMFLLAFILQWLMGVVINAHPNANGVGYAAQGYQRAFIGIAIAQVLALLWYWQRRAQVKPLA